MKDIYLIYCVQTLGGIHKGKDEGIHYLIPTCFQTLDETLLFIEKQSTKGLYYYWNKIQLGKMDLK